MDNNNNNQDNQNYQYDQNNAADQQGYAYTDQNQGYDYYGQQADPYAQQADPYAQQADPYAEQQYYDQGYNYDQVANTQQAAATAQDDGKGKKKKKSKKNDKNEPRQTSEERAIKEKAKEIEKENLKKKKEEERKAKIEAKKEKSLKKIEKENEKSAEEIKELKEYNSEDQVKEIEKKVGSAIVKASEKKAALNTELVLNARMYNRFIDYLPSDFNEKMVLSLFVAKSKMALPKKAKLSAMLYPNDNEKVLKVLVIVDSFVRQGVAIKQQKMFQPFWIIGFGTYSLIATNERPIESKYRVNNIHSFAYAQSQNIRKNSIAIRKTNRKKSNYEVEQDFVRARDNKNWYLKQYVDGLNRLRNIEWECHPRIYLNWSTKTIRFDLYLKIDKVRQDLRKTKWVYVDTFTVKANNVLNIPKKSKIVDIDTLMYLVALNAIYKNIKIFSYKTLYESYKILAAEVMSKGFKLKPITADNLTSLKIVDFSSHFICSNVLFNDTILHIMNLMSSHEEYYRMKYAYTVQKNPSLLFSDFIVKEFKETKVNELSTIIKNQEEQYWNEQLKKLDELNSDVETRNKDYYINNYNVLTLTNNAHKDVESYLMGVIKGEKDEITRLMKLGEEILRIDEDPRFTKAEQAELKKVARKLDDNYKDLFGSLAQNGSIDPKKVKPIKLKDPTKKKKEKKKKNKNEDADDNAVEAQYESNNSVQEYNYDNGEGVNQ